MCLFGFFVYQLLDAGSSLQQAAYDIRVVSQNLSDGRTEAAKRNLALAQERADSAQGRTSGPLVWLGSKVPVVGDDVSAIRTATQVLDNLASDTLPLHGRGLTRAVAGLVEAEERKDRDSADQARCSSAGRRG